MLHSKTNQEEQSINSISNAVIDDVDIFNYKDKNTSEILDKIESDLTKDGSYGLEILVNLAKEHELDPWNIDLEIVAEKYLLALHDNPEENLKEAARAIFFASVLLRMKSEILADEVNEALNIGRHNDFDSLLEEEMFNGDWDNVRQVTFADLEQAIGRRSKQKIKRHRAITLEDLIEALRGAEKEEENREERRKQQQLEFDFEDFIIEPELSDDMLELTHAEDLEGCLRQAKAYLGEYLVDGKFVTLTQLTQFLGSWANAFLAATFLSHDNHVSLKQDEFYGELYIYEPES